MSRYVITITPDNGAQTAHTTVRVDTSSGQTRITELRVEAGSGAGLAPADLPPVDLDLLVRALTAPAPARALASSAQAGLAPQAGSVEPRRRQANKSAPRARTATAKKSTKSTVVKEATGKKAAAGRASARAAATAGSGTRAYRRMPDPEQVMAVYQQTGSLSAVAGHFDVPQHTVAGWARRLRSLGHAIGRS